MDRWTKISVIRRTYSGKLQPAGDAICKTSSSTMRLTMQCHRIVRLIILILVHHYVSFHKSIVLSTNLLEVRANLDRQRPSVREHVTNDLRASVSRSANDLQKKKLIYLIVLWLCRIYPSETNSHDRARGFVKSQQWKRLRNNRAARRLIGGKTT